MRRADAVARRGAGRAAGGDAPPRKECAPQWHDAVLGLLPADRLTLLVGVHAQARYLPHLKRLSLTERVSRFGDKENFWEMGETGPSTTVIVEPAPTPPTN